MRVFQSTLFRVTFAVVLLAGLAFFNRISVDSFVELQTRWPWLLGAILWMLPPYLIVSYRFLVVLGTQGLSTSFGKALRWTMIGSFFDLVMPSNSGGDVIKCAYVVRYVGPGWRTRAVMAVAFDRVLGLLGLFVLGSLAVTFGWQVLEGLPGGRRLLMVLPLITLCSLAFFRVAGSRRLYANPRFKALLQRIPGGARIHDVIGSFNSLREQRKQFYAVLLLSLLNHMCWCAALFCVTRAFGLNVAWVVGFAVFPIVIFGNVLGFAGGFGLGTAVFDLVFAGVLHSGMGAAVGLTFQLLSAVSRLGGLPFYIHAPKADEAPAKNAP